VHPGGRSGVNRLGLVSATDVDRGPGAPHAHSSKLTDRAYHGQVKMTCVPGALLPPGGSHTRVSPVAIAAQLPGGPDGLRWHTSSVPFSARIAPGHTRIS